MPKPDAPAEDAMPTPGAPMADAPAADAPVADAPAEPVTLARPSLDDLVEAWWSDHFPGSPVARVTEIWNHAFAAKEDLKRRLAEVSK